MGSWQPEREIEVKDEGGDFYTLYMWRIPEKDKKEQKEQKEAKNTQRAKKTI